MSGNEVSKSKGKKNKLSLRTSSQRPLLTQLLTAPPNNYLNGSNVSNVNNGLPNENATGISAAALGQENVNPSARTTDYNINRHEPQRKKLSFPKVKLNIFTLYTVPTE